MAPLDVSVGRRPLAISDDVEFLDRLLGPGDVLNVRGDSQRLLEIGATGGSFGHVVLVVGRPRCIPAGSDEAHKLEAVFPLGADRLWSVPIVESTSTEEGLHQAELLLHVDSSRRVIVVGEQPNPDELTTIEPEFVELWLCPAELRSQIRPDLCELVLADMKAHEANWSFCTAARAFLQDALIRDAGNRDHASLLREVQDCWLTAPICTSIVIIFWQRYLCNLAGLARKGESPLDLVLRWMPVKADRGLPDELLGVMGALGWRCLTQVPRSSANSAPVAAAPVLLNSHLNIHKDKEAGTRPRYKMLMSL
mmetsp:Transcript_96330/g.259048  ORF Transcript_96330/g.259048 Transcript_96330/m.259048 type:complete len:309 (-) Transcript_96330:242-1168(-)